jgi:hypothetical protein
MMRFGAVVMRGLAIFLLAALVLSIDTTLWADGVPKGGPTESVCVCESKVDRQRMLKAQEDQARALKGIERQLKLIVQQMKKQK